MKIRSPWLISLLALVLSCASSPPDDSHGWEKEWSLFLRDAPEWPDARERWLSASFQDRYVLLEGLYIVLIGTDEVADPERGQIWSRAAREFLFLGRESVAFLDQAIRQLAGRRPVDRVAIDRVAAVLADLYAVPEMAQAATDPESPMELRYAAVRSLAWMEDDDALPALLEVLRGDAEWTIRARVVEGLEPFVADATVQTALLGALEDTDALVREKAARCLGRVRVRAVQQRLIDQYEMARARGDARQSEALYDALCTSTRRFGVPRTAEAWRRILREEG